MFSFFFFLQIVTDQQTGQKIQIVTALEPSSPGKQQYILANTDYHSAGKVILAKQEGSANKVILSSQDGSGINHLLFASPDLAGQQIQVYPGNISCIPIVRNKLLKGLITKEQTCNISKPNVICAVFNFVYICFSVCD